MRALVTGADGFLGRALVRLLAGRGLEVRALVRRPSPALEALGARVLVGDATDPAALRAGIEGCDHVHHLAGVRRATDPEEFLRVNAGSTRLALEACLAVAPRLRRFVLAGSMAAAGPSATPRREADPVSPVEPYGASKIEAERITLSFADRLPVAVARPPRIMGPGDRENLFFFKIARAGWAVAFSGPPRPLSWIDVDDCARGFLLLAESPAARGGVFFLASPELTSAQGLQLAVAEALGTPVRRVTVPGLVLRSIAEVGELIGSISGRRFPLNRKLAAQALAPGWVCDPSRARDELGFVASTPLAESVRRAVEGYRREGLL